MKSRLLLFGLTAALALPMMAQKATATKADAMARNDRSQMEEIIPFKVNENAAPTFKMNRGQMLWDFETDDQFNGWLIYDADGDGYNWEVDDYYSYNGGTISLTSRSFYNNSALNPDNWLISPKVTFDGNLSFWACGQDPSYAEEHFAVFVTTGDPTDLDSYVQVSDEFVAGYPIQEYNVDLSQFAGQEGYVAFRHFNCSDMFRLNLDNVMIGEPGEQAEWIEIDGILEPSIVLTGLDTETTYEVQVQATNGDKSSDWTESTIFTTLDKDPHSAVEEISVATEDNGAYYNIMGQKMDAGNLPAGIYVTGGRKFVVR